MSSLVFIYLNALWLIRLAGLGGAAVVGAKPLPSCKQIAINQCGSMITDRSDKFPITNTNGSGDKLPTTNFTRVGFSTIWVVDGD